MVQYFNTWWSFKNTQSVIQAAVETGVYQMQKAVIPSLHPPAHILRLLHLRIQHLVEFALAGPLLFRFQQLKSFRFACQPVKGDGLPAVAVLVCSADNII
jgi:hypothetical protein